jgi:aspartyl-tRNA(Asn)/glutamyl-tRNA(Gln) amidotransferase subunit B
MNSIRSVQRALEHEEERQRDALDRGDTLVQETRHFDEKAGTTSPLRTKEYAFDYRYFPEPDLVPFEPAADWVEEIAARLPELPASRRERFASEYGLGPKDIEALTTSSATAGWFEEAARTYGGDAKRIANWIFADLFGLLNEAGIGLGDAKLSPDALAELVTMVDSGAISGKQAKAVLAQMFETGRAPAEIVEAGGMQQISDSGELEGVVDEVIAENPEPAQKVRDGQAGPIGFLVGAVMKKTRGQANPGVVNDLLKRKLSG